MKKNSSILLIFFTIIFINIRCENNPTTDLTSSPVKVDSVYSWLSNIQQPNGLLLSHETGKYVSLYDNALAALVFTSYGDYENAEKIFDFFNSKLESEMLESPGGYIQMRASDGVPFKNVRRRWLGDNAWLLIAINNYHNQAENDRYSEMQLALSNWIISLQDTDGGLWGGYEKNGKKISKISEGIIDAFNAVQGFTDFHINLLDYLENNRWDQEEKVLISWVDNPDHEFALDLHSWGYCIFENFPEEVLFDANRFLTTYNSLITNESITGFCFDEDKDVVWLEGTGQMVVAFNKAKSEEKAQAYLREMKKNIIAGINFPDSYGLPYTVNQGTSYGNEKLWKAASTNPAVSSTAWYLLGLLKFDPFELGSYKNIPSEHKFWIY